MGNGNERTRAGGSEGARGEGEGAGEGGQDSASGLVREMALCERKTGLAGEWSYSCSCSCSCRHWHWHWHWHRRLALALAGEERKHKRSQIRRACHLFLLGSGLTIDAPATEETTAVQDADASIIFTPSVPNRQTRPSSPSPSPASPSGHGAHPLGLWYEVHRYIAQ